MLHHFLLIIIPAYFFKLEILMNNVLSHNHFNTVKLFYENKTESITNYILSNKYYKNHRWTVTNIDANGYNISYLTHTFNNTIIEETLYMHILGNHTMQKFNFLLYCGLLRDYSFKHLIVVYNNYQKNLLSQFSSIQKINKLKVVLCVMDSTKFEIFTSNHYHSNVAIRFNDTQVSSAMWFDVFFSLKQVNLYGEQLVIKAMIEPPQVIIIHKIKARENIIESIGGTDGYIFDLIAVYLKGNVIFNTARKLDELYEKFAEQPHVVYNSIQTHVSINS